MDTIYIEEIQMGVLGLILMIQSVLDIRSKRLPLWITGIGAGIGIIFLILQGSYNLSNATALLPGLLCLVIARVSREAIGYGDGLLLVMMGFYLKVSVLLGVCLWAITLAGIVALFLLATKKRKGKQEIPFVPFIFVGFILEVILC
jgi:leader peptidase (prepilin peptidase)/N-methyltransferase